MAKYKCKVCGYVYDTEVGDEKKIIAPGTPWEEISDAFKCPMCGAPKKMFKLIE